MTKRTKEALATLDYVLLNSNTNKWLEDGGKFIGGQWLGTQTTKLEKAAFFKREEELQQFVKAWNDGEGIPFIPVGVEDIIKLGPVTFVAKRIP